MLELGCEVSGCLNPHDGAKKVQQEGSDAQKVVVTFLCIVQLDLGAAENARDGLVLSLNLRF